MQGTRSGRVRTAGALIVALALCAAFLWVDPRPLPIVLWDESRNAVNALEMRARGLSLVTTYGWVPDLWNTKPPLLIWAMWAAMAVFGASEWTLRLPTMVATIVMLAVLWRHVVRATGSRTTAGLALALLVLSPAMFGEHGARTADYDALLVALTTGYCCQAFAALTRRRPRGRTVLAAGVAVAGAVLTKSAAGLLPGLGLAVFALATGRWRRVSTDRSYPAAAVVAAGAVGVFLLAREAAAPGYLAAVWQNDLGGRFASTSVGVERPAGYYLEALAAGWFAGPLLLVAAPFAWPLLRPRERLAALHAGTIAGVVLAVASMAATKLHHYLLPAAPFMAVLAAIVARAMLRRIAGRGGAVAQPVLRAILALVIAVTAFIAVARAITMRYVAPPAIDGARTGGYGALFALLAPGEVAVIDPGFVLDGRPGYAPVLRAYRLLAAERGLATRSTREIRPGAVTASCAETVVPTLARAGRIVARSPGCIAVLPR